LTFFAVKILDEKGEMSSKQGRVSIGILIIQDIIAVIFLALSAGELPSPWSLALFGLLFARPLLRYLLKRSGHGELLVLMGWLLPIAGMVLFELVDLKKDLGALVIGMLLAGHPKADELSKKLLSFKDLFLVGFFLTIGLSGAPDLRVLGIAALLVLAAPFKVALFFLILSRLKLRARTATLVSLSLGNYSEFGLIVGAVGVSAGWISGQWLLILAIALAITFVAASPLNRSANGLYARWHDQLVRFEREQRLPGDEYISLGEAEAVVLGMGRIGTGAYDRLREKRGIPILGIDHNEATVTRHRHEGRNVIQGEATDSDFWARVRPEGQLSLVLVALVDHQANLSVVRELKRKELSVTMAVAAQYEDEMVELKEAGANAVFNFYDELGAGFAEHVCQIEADQLKGYTARAGFEPFWSKWGSEYQVGCFSFCRGTSSHTQTAESMIVIRPR
jgi:hypothetical protein